MGDPARRAGEGQASRSPASGSSSATTPGMSTRSAPSSGRILWRASAQPRFGGLGTFYATPALAYGRVYVGSTDGKMYSFGTTTGKLRWSRSTGGYVYSSAGGLARPGLRRLVLAHVLVLRRGDRGDVLAVPGRTGRSPARPTVIAGPRVLRDAEGDDVRARREDGAAGCGRTPTASTRRSSPTTTGSTSSATRVSTASSSGAGRSPPMRYVVTGAAGFIGSHLARPARRVGARGRRPRQLHRLLRPGPEGGERRRARRAPRRPGGGRARLRRSRRRLPPGRAARCSQLRRRVPALPPPQRARVAAGVRGRRARRRPRRVLVVVVDLRRGGALPDRRRTSARSRSPRTGSRSSRPSISRTHTCGSSVSTA